VLAAHSNLRATISVLIVLILSITITGTVSSAYRSERTKLGTDHFRDADDLEAKSDLNGAIEEYRRALIFSPNNTEYRLSLANALVNAGRLNEAQSHLEQLQQEDPNNNQVNLALARIAARQNKLQAAIDYYQRAVYAYWPQPEIPRRHAARWELIELLERAKRRNEIVGELIQLYATTPPGLPERNQIGLLLLKYSATSEAAQIFRDLLKAYPQSPVAHRGMAQVDFAQNDFVSARHEYQRAIRLDSNDEASHQGLQLTNTVIDLDGSLPDISSAERLRRNTNLLARVLDDLEKCAGERISERGTEVEAARSLLRLPATSNDDKSLALQAQARRLWALRPELCGKSAPPDAPVDLILGRTTNE
jgi:tetratricopeptide (TPR) repeat protein